MRTATTERRLSVLLVVLFCAAAAVHLHFATLNWRYRFMAGHEFRQTQTALIAHYIDQENNFSPDYSVPLLGKPWVLPLEFPFYEWGVVALSRVTGRPQFESARALSLASFYLTLPAVFLLLGPLGLDRARRLFVLACALLCPVYIFYARAVLVDPLALLCSVWFLLAFTRLLAPGRTSSRLLPRLGWLLLTILTGTAAGLIKSLVWFVWVLPAFAYGLWRLWQTWRSGGFPAALRTIAWGLGAMLVPVVVSLWWARYTDAIKAAHPSAFIFTSANLARDNYGTFSLAARLSGDTWKNLLACWQQSLLPPWALALIVVPALLFLPAWRRRIAAALALFLAAQLLIPLAYAYQDYYFYAANLFAVAALAFVFLGLLDSKLPRLLSAPLLLLPLAALFASYRADYLHLQAVRSFGGSGLTEAIKAYTPPHTVLVVAGDDWCAVIPYYTERRALMIRRGLETDSAYLDRAFADLADEEVSALVLTGDQRGNRALVERAAAEFNLDTAPTFTHPAGDVYCSNFYREPIRERLHGAHGYNQVTTAAASRPGTGPADPLITVPAGAAPHVFSMVRPAPSHYRFAFGYGTWLLDGDRCLNMHAESDLVVPAPATARHIHWEFGLVPTAYERDGDTTDGVVFIIDAESPDGTTRQLLRRVLDPVFEPADRGNQIVDIPYSPLSGERLLFRTRNNGAADFDWSYTRRLIID